MGIEQVFPEARFDLLAAVLDCPCGQPHAVSASALAGLTAITEGKPPAVLVAGYEVPSLYIAMHGLAAADLPTLATAYGWPGEGLPDDL